MLPGTDVHFSFKSSAVCAVVCLDRRDSKVPERHGGSPVAHMCQNELYLHDVIQDGSHAC